MAGGNMGKANRDKQNKNLSNPPKVPKLDNPASSGGVFTKLSTIEQKWILSRKTSENNDNVEVFIHAVLGALMTSQTSLCQHW